MVAVRLFFRIRLEVRNGLVQEVSGTRRAESRRAQYERISVRSTGHGPRV